MTRRFTDDRLLVEEALDESHLANKIYFVENGEELLDYLYQRGKFTDSSQAPRPGLIFLDPTLRQIPIVILTTSKAEEDICKAYDLGASSFISKPVTFEALVDVMKAIGKYWFDIVELPPPDQVN